MRENNENIEITTNLDSSNSIASVELTIGVAISNGDIGIGGVYLLLLAFLLCAEENIRCLGEKCQ